MTYKKFAALALMLSLLAACGIKGDLYLPKDKEVKEKAE
jgi:predicted small lipoprotein YifL